MKFVVEKNIPFAEQAFSSLGEVRVLSSVDFTKDSVRDADVLVIRSETNANRSLLEGSSVRFVGTATIGTDHIDIEYLRIKGITFASAPGCNANSVKEYFIAALLQLANEQQFTLKGKSIGVVGVGNVGRKVIHAAEALGMIVLQNDPPRARNEQTDQFHPLDELMDADIITIHTPLTRDGDDPTYHLFDETRIKKMKPGIIFMNTARGAVVETEALKKAIESRRISYTVLDVWENEPVIDEPLVACTTIATPHIAGYSLEGKVNGVTMVRDAVCKHFGIDNPWSPEAFITPPVNAVIRLPEKFRTLEESLHYVIRQCYDIAFDNESLKRLATIPRDARGVFFRGLRSKYRVRSEFSNFTVILSKAHIQYRDVFTAIGFKCDLLK